MRIVSFQVGGGVPRPGRVDDGGVVDLAGVAPDIPTLLAADDGLARAAEARGEALDLAEVTLLPPVWNPPKIICVGLNYGTHRNETGHASERPDFPVLFPRWATTLVGPDQPMIRPKASVTFDYEGEMVAVIGRPGRHIPTETALEHVAAYSLFNEGSVRDYQRRTSQYTPGKNFDGTGAFGPWLVTADELPPGGAGLAIQTRLNGEVVQDASTADMMFDVAELVSIISSLCTLQPGDVIVSGTPGGVGAARKPPLWMKHGDVVEVEVEGIGVLRNPVVDET